MKDKSKLIISISVAFITMIFGMVGSLLAGVIIDWVKLNNENLQIISAIVGVVTTIIALVIALRVEAGHSKKEVKGKDTDGGDKNG